MERIWKNEGELTEKIEIKKRKKYSYGEDLKKMKVNWPGGWRLRQRKKYSGCRRSYILTCSRPITENIRQLRVLDSGDLNFCVRSTPLRDGHSGERLTDVEILIIIRRGVVWCGNDYQCSETPSQRLTKIYIHPRHFCLREALNILLH